MNSSRRCNGYPPVNKHDHCDRGRNQLSPPRPPPRPLPQPPPPPLTPPFPSSTTHGNNYKQNNLMITGMTVMGSMLSSALLIGIFCALIRFYFNRRNLSRRRSLPIYFGTQDDFLNEDRGPVLDNPIWYINTVGLQQSVIDSITVFKYKKDEKLIEGTECSVCLTEFQEDESLRLLPKCSHAFHLPCIDTWLRSHKNCPLCRAPVVVNCEAAAMVAQASASSEPNNSIDSGSSNYETPDENSENYVVGEIGTSELRSCSTEDGNNSENSKESSDHSHVLIEDDVQQVRRSSVSVDLSSALENYSDVGSVRIGAGTHKHHGSLDTAKGKIVVGKRGSESSSIYKLVKSSSIGRSLSKGPISMKRSFSSGGKFLLSKQSRSQESIPPL